MTNEIKSGIYRHYAGHHYFVMFIARHTETDEELVCYIPMYEHPSGGRAPQVRPLSMFTSEVTLESGEVVKRFKYVGEKLDAK